MAWGQFRNYAYDFYFQAMKIRQEIAENALEDTLAWLRKDGEVAIFDATNVTLSRRQMVYDKVVVQNNFMCLFIESVCDSEDLIRCNIKDVKVNGPDYKGMNLSLIHI